MNTQSRVAACRAGAAASDAYRRPTRQYIGGTIQAVRRG
jgi:hypothetical protein